MRDKMTTTRSGFRVEDVTFHKARRQSEIVNELNLDIEDEEITVEAPKSLTPEQVIKYYENLISVTSDLDAKRVYAQTIRWIKEMQELKLTVSRYRELEARRKSVEETPDDIQEDSKEEIADD